MSVRKNKKFLTCIATENQKLSTDGKIFVPVTQRIRYDDAEITRCPVNTIKTRLLFMEATTNQCVRYLIENKVSENVFAHNFASEGCPGGGYLNGAKAQEEFECYEIPGLYPSISKVKYPLEPGTILVTPGLRILRDSDTYELLPEEKQINLGIVSAAAQNLSKSDAVYNDEQTKITLANLFCSVKKSCPSTDTLVLGAWGCGVFRNDPKVMAREILDSINQFGGYYRTICIAIPPGPNVREFREVFGDLAQDLVLDESEDLDQDQDRVQDQDHQTMDDKIMRDNFEAQSACTYRQSKKSNRKKINSEKHQWVPEYD
jgi:uncharacterized protein (TIGR02452 family)